MLPYTLALLMALPLYTCLAGHPASGADQESGSIPIGLLIPDSTRREAITAARMAIDAANDQGGFHGIPFTLVVRSTEGPWGAGSKESVGLVYEDRVVAIVGALDGRNGHLAEQVATKSHLVYLETLATESTLSQAFVPYFLRVVPNDDQQARAILDKAVKNRGGIVAVLYDQQYDHLYAARSFSRIASRAGYPDPVLIATDTLDSDPDQFVDLLQRHRVAHLVVPFRTEETVMLLRKTRQALPHITLYGTLGLITGMVPGDPSWSDLEGAVIVSPGSVPLSGGSAFEKQFRERIGHAPPVEVAFTYDGISAITRAVRNAGTDRESVKKELTGMQIDGITGMFSFDEMGNRLDTIRFFQLKDGKPIPAHARSIH